MTSPKTVDAKRIYTPLDKVMVRLPLLPVEFYLESCANRVVEYPKLDDIVKYALCVGSRSLSSALQRGSSTSKDLKNDRSKLLRYLIRMSTRPTPYGIFATVGLVGVNGRTSVIRQTEVQTTTRPDMGWLLRLVGRLEADHEIRKSLAVAANPAAYVHGNRVYLHEKLPSGHGQSEARVSVRATRAVRRALELARDFVPYRDLVAGICAMDRNYSEAKVETLLDDLFSQTLLISELRPPLTHLTPGEHVIKILRKIPPAKSMFRNMELFTGILSECDRGNFAERFDKYNEAHKFAESFTGVSGEPVAQVDAAVALGDSHISKSVAEEVAHAAELLLSITPYPRGFSHLEPYLNAFEAKYGQSREVPLLELLDPNFGLGAPPDYSNGFSGGISRVNLSKHNQTLIQMAAEALYEKKQVVLLDENTLNSLKTCKLSALNAPVSVDVCAFVSAKSEEEIDKGNFQVVIGPNLGAMGAGRTFGRFGHLFGGTIPEVVGKISKIEELGTPGKVWAELVYIPKKYRSGNVVVRAGSRKYEIVLGVTPGVSQESLIRLDELVVGIKNRRFYLRSTRLNAQVLISSGHMLNYLSAPAICKFLLDVGRPLNPQLYVFDWGPASNFPFLPRVQYDRIVLSPAQWHIWLSNDEFKASNQNNFEGIFDAWKGKWNVPRYIYISCGDNRLLLDTKYSAHIQEIYSELRKSGEGGLILQEVCPGLDAAWVKGTAGHYMSELVVPLICPKVGKPPAKSERQIYKKEAILDQSDKINQVTAREVPPGGDWLYLKLYCGKDLEEELLSHVEQFISTGAAAKYAEEVFFIRYSDPDPHIRIRFRGKPAKLTGKLLPVVCKWASDLMKEEVCLRFAFDTYDREIERYGGAYSIALAESVFAADTNFALQTISGFHSKTISFDRINLAVLSLRDLLDSMGLAENESVEWCAKMVSSRDAVSSEYRRRKTVLQDLLTANDEKLMTRVGEPLFRALKKRKTAVKPLGLKFIALAAAGKLHLPYWNILRSLAHMHCNRLLGTDSWSEETALGLLFRTLQGNKAMRAATILKPSTPTD